MKNLLMLLILSASWVTLGQAMTYHHAPQDERPLSKRELNVLNEAGMNEGTVKTSERYIDGETTSTYSLRKPGTQKTLNTPRAQDVLKLTAGSWIYNWIAPKVIVPAAVIGGGCNLSGKHWLSILPWSLALGTAGLPLWKIYNLHKNDCAAQELERRRVADQPSFKGNEGYLVERTTKKPVSTNPKGMSCWTPPGVAWMAWRGR